MPALRGIITYLLLLVKLKTIIYKFAAAPAVRAFRKVFPRLIVRAGLTSECAANNEAPIMSLPGHGGGRRKNYYHCVEDYFETIIQCYDERFSRQYGFWRPLC